MAKKKFKLKHYISYIAVIIFLIVTVFMASSGSLNRSTQNLITQISYSIILAVSLNLVIGFLGELSLGHAGFMCVGAYLGCFLANNLHSVIDSPLLILIISMLARRTYRRSIRLYYRFAWRLGLKATILQ